MGGEGGLREHGATPTAQKPNGPPSTEAAPYDPSNIHTFPPQSGTTTMEAAMGTAAGTSAVETPPALEPGGTKSAEPLAERTATMEAGGSRYLERDG